MSNIPDMGYYLTDHETAVCESRRKPDMSRRSSLTEPDPSKNRVWKNFSTSRPRTGFFASQLVEPHWEKQPTPTTTASGVLYYGYRFYSPDLGRWLNRDLIEEEGGANLYMFAENNAICKWDLLGKRVCEGRCAKECREDGI